MTFRRLLDLIGLATRGEACKASVLLSQMTQEVIRLRAERDALRAENANLKRAFVEKIEDDFDPMDRYRAGSAPQAEPFGREWLRPGPGRTVFPERLTAAAPACPDNVLTMQGHCPELATTVDCLEGDKPRGRSA
jgi:hypothetical protein